MKKLLLITAIFAFTVTSTQAQIRFGVKGGLNLASLYGSDVDSSVNGKAGFHVGGVVNIRISDLFAVQPELLYSGQGYGADGSDAKVSLDYVNVPIMADFTLIEGLSLQAGPQFGFNVSSKVKGNGEFEDGELDNVNTVDLGIGIGAQYILPFNLFFQARYNTSFSNVFEKFDGEIAKAKNQVVSLSVGYFFN